MKRDKLLDAIERELEIYGIASRLEERSKHRMLRWEVNGVKQAYTISRSPGDYRAILACVTGVRRLFRQAGIQT